MGKNGVIGQYVNEEWTPLSGSEAVFYPHSIQTVIFTLYRMKVPDGLKH